MATLKLIGMVLLLLAAIGSAMAIVYCTYSSRLIFTEMQKQATALDQYDVEWGQMQVELNMLLRQTNIETVAREQLNLTMPLREKIIYIEP
jgi:cell division protein FtsL